MQLIDAAMTRSRTVILGLIVILVVGMYAYMTIPKEAEPDVEIPLIYVQMTHDGISPGRRTITGPTHGAGNPHGRGRQGDDCRKL